MSIYLDYNATTPIDPRVLDKMIQIYREVPGNPDSRTHDFGDAARKEVELARGKVASLLGVKKDEVYFTSGATESNNIAIQGLKEYAIKSGKQHIITTAIEHKAVLETVRYMASQGFEVDIVKPNSSGAVQSEDIIKKVRDDTLLVSVMHVNNETGIIQPVKEIGQFLATQNTLFHVDATQSCGKLIEEIRELQYDMLSFSAHKLYGPQGVGCLILRRKNYSLPPVKNIMYGGQQEKGIRPGTVPAALVAGCGTACELALQNYESNNDKLVKLKKILLSELEKSKIKYRFNGDQQICVDNTANICFYGVESEALMIATKQYCGISNGSACTSKSYVPSYVLTAMDIKDEDIQNSVRISWGISTDPSIFRNEISKLLEIAKQLAL